MSEFPIDFDEEQGTIRLRGEGGASVMLAFLLKAKFGDALDPEVLFHPQLAALMVALRERSISPSSSPSGPFDRAALHLIARHIVDESWRSGWWTMSRDEQTEFIQSVVVAPYRLSAEQLDWLFDGVETALFWRRKVVEAASEASVA